MIKVIIDANKKSELEIAGDEGTCYQEISIALLKICETLSESTGYSFGDIFDAVVANARMLAYFKGKEREYHENRT